MIVLVRVPLRRATARGRTAFAPHLNPNGRKSDYQRNQKAVIEPKT
ncbi:hypothetical protein [Chroococcus sp. FPU101]|nr:hypothetical protein [Chroococcus sp. FPU101]